MAMSLIGRRLGNYDIQSKIGEGGMGLVYLGIHPQIGKKVAVKVLHEELRSKAEVVGGAPGRPRARGGRRAAPGHGERERRLTHGIAG